MPEKIHREILLCRTRVNFHSVSESVKSELSKNPLVSVSIITYNHREFIANTLESVLKQKVDFEYEIVIGDDFSQDGTQEIIKAYQKKYPDKIQLILHPRDYDCVPGRVNNITNLYACRGKYIAMLDGDDLWLSEDKLKTQVDFLEAHDDFALSFHEMLLSFDDGRQLYYNRELPYFTEDVFTHEDVTSGWFIQTSSIVFRNGLIGEFPEWFWEIYSADYAIQLLVSQHGKIKFFPDLLAQRNFHPKSFSATQNTTDAHRLRRKRERAIFEKHFPGFGEFKNYDYAKTRLRFAKHNLNKMHAGSFILNMAKSMVYSGLFVTGKNLKVSKKINLIKRDFNRKFRKKP